MQFWTEHHYILDRTDSLFVYDTEGAVSLSWYSQRSQADKGFDIEFTTAQLPEIRELYLALETLAKHERAEAATTKKA